MGRYLQVLCDLIKKQPQGNRLEGDRMLVATAPEVTHKHVTVCLTELRS
jgi:hypothetical protein